MTKRSRKRRKGIRGMDKSIVKIYFEFFMAIMIFAVGTGLTFAMLGTQATEPNYKLTLDIVSWLFIVVSIIMAVCLLAVFDEIHRRGEI